MLILLDIDGVMVPAKSWSPPPILEDGFSIFNPKSVIALNAIISKSNADILLTTSHKGRFSIHEWISIFSFRGVKVNGLNKLPDNLHRLSRSQEITKWFNSTDKVDDFVIIDDDKSLNGISVVLKNRVVLTKPLIGLTQSHIQDALLILDTPLELVSKSAPSMISNI